MYFSVSVIQKYLLSTFQHLGTIRNVVNCNKSGITTTVDGITVQDRFKVHKYEHNLEGKNKIFS